MTAHVLYTARRMTMCTVGCEPEVRHACCFCPCMSFPDVVGGKPRQQSCWRSGAEGSGAYLWRDSSPRLPVWSARTHGKGVSVGTGVGKLDDTCLLRASCAVSFKPSEETTWRTYPLKIGLRYPHNPSPEKKKGAYRLCHSCCPFHSPGMSPALMLCALPTQYMLIYLH